MGPVLAAPQGGAGGSPWAWIEGDEPCGGRGGGSERGGPWSKREREEGACASAEGIGGGAAEGCGGGGAENCGCGGCGESCGGCGENCGGCGCGENCGSWGENCGGC